MNKTPVFRSGLLHLRFLIATSLCLTAIFLAALSTEASAGKSHSITNKQRRNASIAAAPQSTPMNGPSGPGWSLINSPNAVAGGQARGNNLESVSCASTTNCFSVGDYFNGSNYQTLIEHWDGAAWSIVSSPNVGDSLDNHLYGVTCISATQCFAVGFYSNSYGYSHRTLIEQWDGTSWSIITSPSSIPDENYLYGVTCTSAEDCFAVGYYYDGSYHKTLIEHWDGISWSIVTSANSSITPENYLYDVTCTSGTNCFAVGNQGYYAAGGYDLIEHWDGTSWSIVASPNKPSTYLFGVKCTSASRCFAVGYSGNSSLYQTLIEQWDGTAWSVSASPNSDATLNNMLHGVDCLSASKCFAVGFHDTGVPASAYQTLIEYWDGTGWSIVSSPDTSSSFLSRVTCSSEPQCWAVGTRDHLGGGFSQTLMVEYAPTVPSLISAGSRMTHGTVGPFDVDLPLIGKRGVECRASAVNGNYSIVFSFVNDVSNCGNAGTVGGSVVAGPNSNQCTENLTGIANAQYVDVELDNVVDALNNTGNVAVEMGVLIGDTTANGLVNSSDISQAQSQSGQTLTIDNFRADVTLNGLINSSDVSLIQSASGTALPSSP